MLNVLPHKAECWKYRIHYAAYFKNQGFIFKPRTVDIRQHLLLLTKPEGVRSLLFSNIPSLLSVPLPHSLASSRMIFPWVWVCMQSNGVAPMRSYCSILGLRYGLGYQFNCAWGKLSDCCGCWFKCKSLVWKNQSTKHCTCYMMIFSHWGHNSKCYICYLCIFGGSYER